MLSPLIVGFAGIAVGIVYASFAEWTIHRQMMHRPLFGIRHFFRGHAQVHHVKYKGDASYEVGDRIREDLTLAWWAMPLPILTHVPVLVLLGWLVSAPAAAGAFGALVLYQTTYEYIHYCMHVPSGRLIERSRVFQWLNAHHREHHRKLNANLNIVLPLADLLFRTRSRGPVSGVASAARA